MNNVPFLKYKLTIPDIPKQSLFCERIKNMQIAENRLSILTAPAGFGKTTAVLMCLEKERENVKWYGMDKEDSFLPVFYAHLLDTLFSEENKDEIGSINMLNGLQNIEEDYLLLNAQIVQDAFMLWGGCKKKIYLVLDDFHNVVNNHSIIDTVQYLVLNMPKCFSAVVTSRVSTGIVADKLLLRDDIKEIHSSGMLFSKEEMSELVNDKYNLNLNRQQINLVFDVTEGWIAGIYMMCHGMDFSKNPESEIENIKKGKSFFKTFLHRFLQDIPGENREILTKLSVLDDFTVEELETLFNIEKPKEFIKWIENSNLYIQKIRAYPTKYRFHALFREELKELFYAETDEKKRFEFFLRLANHYLKDNPRLAIRFYLLSKDSDSAFKVVKELGEELFNKGNPEEMFYIINEFSEKDIRKNPYLLLFSGMTKVNIDRQRSLDTFLLAMDGFKACKDYSFLMNTFGMMLVIAYQSNNFVTLKTASEKLPIFSLLFAGRKVIIKLLISIFIAFTGKDGFRYAGILRRILDKLSIKDDMWQYSYLMIRGIYYYRSGELEKAYENMQKILNHTAGISNDQWRIIGLVSCCNIPFLRMDKESMRTFAEEFYALGEKYNSPFSTGYGHYISAHEKYRRNDIPSAIEAIDNSIDSFNEYNGELLVFESRLIHFLWSEKKPSAEELTEAENILAKIKEEDPGHGLLEFSQNVVGVMQRRIGHFDKAEENLLQALHSCKRKKALQSVAGLYLQLAYLYKLWGKKENAVKNAEMWEKYSRKYRFVFWRESDKEAVREIENLLHITITATTDVKTIENLSLTDSVQREIEEEAYGYAKLLGKFSIRINDILITENDFKTRKVSGILKYIILKGQGEYINREKIATIFWPESGQKAANTSLRVALYEMRKTLSQKGVGLEDDCGFIVEKKEGFALKPNINMIRDIDIIEKKYSDFRRCDKSCEDNMSCLKEICDLYDGGLLDGHDYDDSILIIREHFSAIFFESLCKLSELLIDKEFFDDAEKLLNKGLEIDPLNEGIYGMLIRLYTDTDRTERATYLRDSFTRRFKKEMGVEPAI